MTIKAAAAFDGRSRLCWATSYTFEPVFFESFLLPRLGGPPLNATLLVDAHRYADALQDLASDAPWRSSRANRDYLIRGVAPTDAAFHPKTYLFASERGGRLLVGSGNLAMSGLETGKETFAAFDAQDEDGLAAIRSWRAWMDGLVNAVGDDAVRARWTDALVRKPWLAGPVGPSPFVSNWDRPLIDALLDGVEGPVDEVHLTAPFFDARADAIAELLRRTRPRNVTLLLGRDANVDGAALVAALDASGAAVKVMGVEPDTFVHAKLLGIVTGDQGRLLSGSANLSGAALLRVASTDPHANVEAGVIAKTDADSLRAAFTPPDLRLVARDPGTLAALRFVSSPDRSWSVRLRSAAWLPDRRVTIVIAGPPHAGMRLASATETGELADGVTLEPFAGDSSRLAWLIDEAGGQLSNKVAIDEPDALHSALLDRTEAAGDRPTGLDAADLDTPVGQMLARLHEACIFDFDDTPTARRVGRAVEDDEEDPEFWDRLARDDLRSDPRLPRYQQLHNQLELLDGLFLDIARMRDAVPPLAQPTAVGEPEDPGVDPAVPRSRWTPDRRLQVRLFNLLERWCAALSDPRLLWVSPAAPVANYAALVTALRECWTTGYLREERVTALVGVLLGAMVATERRRGFLAALDEADSARAATALSGSEAPEIAGGLLWGCLRPARRDLLSYLFDWQPALRLAAQLGAVRTTDRSAEIALELTETKATATAIEERIAWAATYTNDTRWCEVVGRELRLRSVEFAASKVAPRFGAVIRVSPGVDLLGQAQGCRARPPRTRLSENSGGDHRVRRGPPHR